MFKQVVNGISLKLLDIPKDVLPSGYAKVSFTYDNDKIEGYQYFKIYDEQQLEYPLFLLRHAHKRRDLLPFYLKQLIGHIPLNHTIIQPSMFYIIIPGFSYALLRIIPFLLDFPGT